MKKSKAQKMPFQNEGTFGFVPVVRWTKTTTKPKTKAVQNASVWKTKAEETKANAPKQRQVIATKQRQSCKNEGKKTKANCTKTKAKASRWTLEVS